MIAQSKVCAPDPHFAAASWGQVTGNDPCPIKNEGKTMADIAEVEESIPAIKKKTLTVIEVHLYEGMAYRGGSMIGPGTSTCVVG